jgi:hypothetical protein
MSGILPSPLTLMGSTAGFALKAQYVQSVFGRAGIWEANYRMVND